MARTPALTSWVKDPRLPDSLGRLALKRDRGGIFIRRSLGLVLSALVLVGPASGAQDLPGLTRIAFGSCADQRRAQPIWDAVLRYAPQAFIFAGDNVYGDVSGETLDELREAYAQTGAVPGFQGIRTGPRVLAVWDDHDYGANDAGAEFRFKHESKALFLDFWQVPPDDPRRTREGIYHAVVFGPPGQRVQVVLLDTRWFRSPLRRADTADAPGKGRYRPDPDPEKTLLGAAQWRWLEQRLRDPADLRLVVSSVQVLAEDHGWERWGNLPGELERLIDLVRSTGANGVILLSGDRHFGGLYQRRDGVPYPFHEITSSSLNRPYWNADEHDSTGTEAVYGGENFGTVDIDWWAQRATLSVRSLNGEAVRSAVIPLASLAPH
jgi:alkaline phosphatase D